MGEPIRVLQVVTHMNRGGLETMLMNYYRHMDHEKVQFDFIEYGEVERDFDYKYKELGAKIYKLPDRKKHPLKAKKELSKILKENDYQVVHLHKNSLSDIGAIRVCEKMKVPTIVVHSHNSSRDNKIIVFLHRINRKLLKFDDIIKFSCSDTAANWLFGDTKGVQYVKNGIDTSKFDYNLEVRKRIREKIKVYLQSICLCAVGEQRPDLAWSKIIRWMIFDGKNLFRFVWSVAVHRHTFRVPRTDVR